MICINEIIVVEGKYDKIKLSRIFDTLILTTDGFRIYKNREKAEMLKSLAKKRGVIILTDSDRAGFRIRSRVSQLLTGCDVKNVYIPKIEGREKRKAAPSAEGFLGVEGVSDEIIINAVMAQAKPSESKGGITKTDFYMLGLSGHSESAALREMLAAKAGLPVGMPCTAMVEVINVLYSKKELYELMDKITHI